ncbi:SNF2-related protein [Metarhizium album ARSEF 1941]|uniref:SNF2-related protein n=1 Tax=Metarhizium album (strain ARSEF 1941) TaxID=1081103 RepID=A0A0B2WSJ9_METAS|nr:SNF2-related protein [Metarhizium album ARSEF 1941]KHN96599.1 SNF2-related protein [Metarhizium album ARSEF 1941]
MNIQNENQIIEIPDDDSTASEDENSTAERAASRSRKRKVGDDDVSEKVHWSDGSDAVPVKPAKRRAKRKSIAKNKQNPKPSSGHEARDEPDLGDIPDYLQERRRKYDANRKQYHEAALMLPPDYTDIDFLESTGTRELKQRPEFDARSGVKPSRPYKDIELPQSAGLIPAPIAQYLRDYQVVGAKFLHRKFVFQEGCILGDDMGLGKTVQVAAFLAAAFGKTGDERDDRRMREVRFRPDRWYPRILVVCPGSLIINWKNELNRWGWWHVDIYHGANKDDVMGTARSGLLEIMITTYDTYKNNRSAINMVPWDACIADECHRLKERSSETTKAMNEVNSLCRIGLTGTAIQNKYEELWTLLDWTNPGHLGTKPEWMQAISKPLTVGQSHDATVAQLSLARQTAKKLVQNLLPRYFLRRMKSLIADQLPRKTDRVVFCPLTDVQAEAYESFLSCPEIHLLRTVSDPCPHGRKKGWCCQTRLPDGRRWPAIVFPSMMTLQKLANHLALLTPSTTDLDSKHKKDLETLKLCLPDTWRPLYEKRDQIRSLVDPELCGKWKVMKKLLRFWHQNGDKVLVFSHSVRLLRILQHLFTSTSYNVSYLDGSLSYEERQDVVDTFNSDPMQFVFLISTKAGGVGLNITSANKVVIVDPHWNPSYDLQAQDRAYRIGQTRDVEVFRLISQGTVEEIVYARQVYKQQQANIGYTASSERRYFKGVQHDEDRKGEIFGLSNIFTYHGTSSLVRNIVNNTNIAEAKAGVDMADVDMERAAKDEEALSPLIREEGGAEDGGAGQMAALLTAENQQQLLESKKSGAPKSDAIQAILASAGVEYTHDNSEVIGTSKIEEQLSRRAAMRSYADGDAEGQNTLFADSQDEDDGTVLHSTYRPPEDVCLRQFCSMGQEFGFINATEFALVVESWSQEARRNCLDAFYRRREAQLEGAENSKAHRAAEAAAEAVVEDGDAKDVVNREDVAQVKDEDTTEDKDKKTKTITDENTRRDVEHGDIDAEGIKLGDSKTEGMTDDNIKEEGVKTADVEHGDEGAPEGIEVKPKTFKVEGTSKKDSIFISDDGDDEL